MPRTKEYIREDVVDAATKVFWTKGFKGASVRDLVNATGLNKHSMYQEFGSKEGLFQECIENFAQKTNKEPNLILRHEPLGIGNIEAFFQNRIDYAASSSCLGCFLVNTTVEKELIDAGAFAKTQDYLALLEENLLKCLVAGQRAGDVQQGKDCRVLANYLMNVIVGMMVLSKSSPSRETLESMVEVALSAIKT